MIIETTLVTVQVRDVINLRQRQLRLTCLINMETALVMMMNKDTGELK